MAAGKVPDGYVDKRRFDVIQWSIENAVYPEKRAGPEILLAPNRSISHKIRKLFEDCYIVGVTVTCPNNHNYILIKMESHTYRKTHPKQVQAHFQTRIRLFRKLDKIITSAYPYLDSQRDLIVYDIGEDH